MKTGTENKNACCTFEIHANVGNVYMNYLLKFEQLNCIFNKYLPFYLGHLDMGNFPLGLKNTAITAV